MTNSANHNLQWRHPLSIDLNAFILLKNLDRLSVYVPIHFAHALHMHAKYYLDDIQTYRGCTAVSKNIYFSRILSMHCRVIMHAKYFSNAPCMYFNEILYVSLSWGMYSCIWIKSISVDLQYVSQYTCCVCWLAHFMLTIILHVNWLLCPIVF